MPEPVKRRGRMGFGVCLHCQGIFERRLVDLKRSARHYCSTAHRDAAGRRGRTMANVTCANPACAKPFQKLQSDANRCRRHFCSPGCYAAVVDRVALGKLAGAAPHRLPPLTVRRERSRKGGLARAANQPREKLSEIGQLGVRARMALPPEERSAAARRASQKRLGVKVWFGVPVSTQRRRADG